MSWPACSVTNVRLIAATHRDFEAAVERGTFREDLYYRLRHVVLEVPPLRERREDIPLLVEHFIEEINGRYRFAVRGATREALRLLGEHPWRGNVRELEAVLEQAVIFGDGEWITAEDLDLLASRGAKLVEGRTGADDQGPFDPRITLSWLQREALRIAGERRELRRRELIARCRISREVARRELAGLVRLGLLRLIGRGRGARYVPLWLSLMGDVVVWAAALM